MSKFYSREQLNFILNKVHQVEDLLSFDRFKEHNSEVFDMVLDAAHTLAEKHLYPIHLEMDYEEPKLVDGKIHVHPKMKEITKLFGDQGWISSTADYDEGGQQLPSMIAWAASYIMAAANYSAVAFYGLSQGASELIRAFGTSEQKGQYIPKIFSGDWQGTMAMTEPEAGSSLSDIITSATPTEEGYYLMKGQKIFISCGDHDACENIVHMMLARIDGAPSGAKGLSLFIVPQKRIVENDTLENNDVITGGIYHKLGYKGAPIAHLMIGENDNCRGYLVGEQNKGLQCMFKMMNGARISVGLHATSISSAAYYASLQYAKERKQGRLITNKDVSQPQVPIIEHADVKRMLLFQKAITEGSLSLLMQCTRYEDLSYHGKEEEREKYSLLLDILTPIAKSYPAEMGILSTSAAIQIHGGYGYTQDFSAEKYFREVRIHTLHEGTTAMHGMDLLGRKIIMKNGKAIMFLLQEVNTTIKEALSIDQLSLYANVLKEKVNEIQQVTMQLMGLAQKGKLDVFLADASLYLELFSIMTVGWQWLKMGIAATKELEINSTSKDLMGSNIQTIVFYFEYEVPKTHGLLERLKSKNNITLDINPDYLM